MRTNPVQVRPDPKLGKSLLGITYLLRLTFLDFTFRLIGYHLINLPNLSKSLVNKIYSKCETTINNKHVYSINKCLTGWPKNLETWNNLEFDKLGKIKNLEFYRKIMEKPGTFF